MAVYRKRGGGARRLVRFWRRRCSLMSFTLSLSMLIYLAFFGMKFPFLDLNKMQVNQGTSTIEIVKSRWKYAHDHLAWQHNSTTRFLTDRNLNISTPFPKLDIYYNSDRNASQSRAHSNTSLRKTSKSESRKRHVPCGVNFKENIDELVEPESYMNYTNFLLTYVAEEGKQNKHFFFDARFGGHQTLEERENSYYARNQTLHCGFVRGPEGYPSSGFDLNEQDKGYMAACRVVVSSCIFGSSDFLRRPASKMKDKFLMTRGTSDYGELLL